MDNTQTIALKHLKEKLKSYNYEQIAELTGFRKEKIFQWNKNQSFPSLKIAKELLKLWKTVQSKENLWPSPLK